RGTPRAKVILKWLTSTVMRLLHCSKVIQRLPPLVEKRRQRKTAGRQKKYQQYQSAIPKLTQQKETIHEFSCVIEGLAMKAPTKITWDVKQLKMQAVHAAEAGDLWAANNRREKIIASLTDGK